MAHTGKSGRSLSQRDRPFSILARVAYSGRTSASLTSLPILAYSFLM